MKNNLPTSLVAATLLFSASSNHLLLADNTWDGGGVNANWSTNGNWGLDTPPDPAANPLVFRGNVRTTNNNDFAVGTSVKGITFATGANDGPFTLNGNSITLTGNVTDEAVAGPTVTHTINFGIILNASRNISVGNSNLTVGEAISQATATNRNLGITKSGIVSLNGTNTYGGTTTLSGGARVLINGNSAGATGAVIAGATTTLGGIGIIGGATTIDADATFAPGMLNTAGLLTLNSSLTFSSVDSKSNFQIANGARGTNYDAVNIAGLLTYGGDFTLTLDAVIANGTYDLYQIGAGGFTGSYDSILLGGSGPYAGALTNNSGIWTGSSNGQNFTFTQSSGDLLVSPIPEPGAVILLTGSLALLAFRRCRG